MPVRVVAFNTVEGWSRDVSEGSARWARRNRLSSLILQVGIDAKERGPHRRREALSGIVGLLSGFPRTSVSNQSDSLSAFVEMRTTQSQHGEAGIAAAGPKGTAAAGTARR
jgi:hypothetical protein